MNDDLKERAQKFFIQLMGPQLEVLEAISPSPLPEIIEAFIAWLEKEMRKEIGERVPFVNPQPSPITPQPQPAHGPIWIAPCRTTSDRGYTWSETVKNAAVHWAKTANISFSSPAEAVANYAQSMSKNR